MAHHLVWLLTYGVWPEREVDHKFGDRSDNRPCHLRLATHSQNVQNMKLKTDNTSGFKGAMWYKRNQKWGSSITANGVRRFLGLFDTAEEAAAAYAAASLMYHGEFARPEG